MIWGAHGAENPSDGGIRWHDVSEAVNRPNRVPAGQDPVGAGQKGRPQQDSNLRSRLRSPKPSKSRICTDLPVECFSGRNIGVGGAARPVACSASNQVPGRAAGL